MCSKIFVADGKPLSLYKHQEEAIALADRVKAMSLLLEQDRVSLFVFLSRL